MSVIKTNPRRRFLRSTLTVGATLACPFAARAVTTAETGRAVIGFQVPPPAMHLLAEVLTAVHANYQPDLGTRPVVLPGGSGALAVETVSRSARDGATVLIGPSTLVTLLPIMQKLPVDFAEILVPVAGIGEAPLAFIVGNAVPAQVRTMSDYIQWVRDHPTANSYGVPGLATAPHFIGAQISRVADLPLRVVGYKGMPALHDDLHSGALPAAITLLPGPSELSSYPSTRLLGIAGTKRLPGFGELQTLTEVGLGEPSPMESLGFFMPAGTPEPKVRELAAAVRAATQTRAVMDAMAAISMFPIPASVDSYAAELARERATWQALVTRYNFTGRD